MGCCKIVVEHFTGSSIAYEEASRAEERHRKIEEKRREERLHKDLDAQLPQFRANLRSGDAVLVQHRQDRYRFEKVLIVDVNAGGLVQVQFSAPDSLVWIRAQEIYPPGYRIEWARGHLFYRGP